MYIVAKLIETKSRECMANDTSGKKRTAFSQFIRALIVILCGRMPPRIMLRG